jgi:hypothetical protein
MPNRGQSQDQDRKRNTQQQNPGTFSPDDDEAQQADQTKLDDQQPTSGRKRRDSDARNPQASASQDVDADVDDADETLEDDDIDDEDDDEEPIGGRP